MIWFLNDKWVTSLIVLGKEQANIIIKNWGENKLGIFKDNKNGQCVLGMCQREGREIGCRQHNLGGQTC